jgi:curved DNA-binding protein CbpA
MRRNLYDLLGVRPDDDAEHLRKAFLKAAKESHPDHHGNDPDAVARFREITEAYDVLRDAGQRAAYDRFLEAEHRPLRSTLTSASTGLKCRLITGAIIGVIFVAALAGGYELYARMSETAVDEGARTADRDPSGIAADMPVGQGGSVERGRPAAAPSPQMPIVLRIENPAAPAGAALARQPIDVAGNDSRADLPADSTGAKAGPDASAKETADELKNRPDAPSASVQTAAATTLSAVPGLSSSDVASPANRPGREMPGPAGAGSVIVKQPAESAETGVSARIHATMNRPPASRPPFRRAAPPRRYTFVRMHAPHCEDD